MQYLAFSVILYSHKLQLIVEIAYMAALAAMAAMAEVSIDRKMDSKIIKAVKEIGPL
jgi:hypothetical protein